MIKSVCEILLYFVLATIIFSILLCAINVYYTINILEQKIEDLESDNKALWENIDALSEDYTLLYYEIYKKEN